MFGLIARLRFCNSFWLIMNLAGKKRLGNIGDYRPLASLCNFVDFVSFTC